MIHRTGVKIGRTRGQYYESAATMSGTKCAVAAQTKSLNKKVLYSYCYGHALNLAANACIRKFEVLKDAWVIIKEVYNLVKKSPSRETKLQKTRETTKNLNKYIRAFCPTQWTIHGETCASVFNNHEDLMEL